MLEYIGLYSKTILLYGIIILSSSGLAFLSYRKRKSGRYVWNPVWFVFSFLILLFFMGFANCGTDYDSYQIMYENCFNWSHPQVARIERGYVILNMVVKIFALDFQAFHFIWAFILLSLIFSTVSTFKTIVSPGLSILAYTCMFMIQSLNLMRMYLAVAIIFWGIRYIIRQNYLSYAMVILVAFLFHRSAIVFVLPFVMIVMLSKKGHYLIKVCIYIVLFAVVFILRSRLFSYGLLGYSYYSADNGNGEIGLAIVVYVLPIILIILYYFKKETLNDDVLFNSLICFLGTYVGFYALSYFIPMIGRINNYFTYIYMILPQYLLTNYEKINAVKKNSWHILTINSIIRYMLIFYFLFRAYMMIEYIEIDGMQIYSNVFGLILQ